MIRRSIQTAAAGCWLAAIVSSSAAQPVPPPGPVPAPAATADQQCEDKAAALDAAFAAAEAAKKHGGCERLADTLYVKLQDQFQDQINAANAVPPSTTVPLSLIQPKDNDSKGGQGSPAQAAAVPSVQPVAGVGGTIAVAATTAGTAVVSAVAINPVTLFDSSVPDPDPAKSKTYAEYSRFADVSLILPANVASTLPNGDVSFVGVRARVNITGLHEGDTVFDAVHAAQRSTQATYDAYRKQLVPALRAAPNVAVCADAILTQDEATVVKNCGADVTLSATAAEAVHSALAAAAEAADAKYLGVDLRADFGDPTFSHDPMAGGTYLLAAAAGGVQVSPNFALRGRAGVAYTKLTKDTTASFAADYGAAAEIGGGSAQRRIRVSIGIEGRTGSEDPLAEQHFLNLKLGLSIPVADGKSLGIGLTKPLAFENQMSSPMKSTLLTITGDVGLGR